MIFVATYIYSFWSFDRQKQAEIPVEADSMMMGDLLCFHKKRGGFPEDLQKLEGVVWERRERLFSPEERALNHRNYYFFYTQFFLINLLCGRFQRANKAKMRQLWFLVVSPDICRRFKGTALPLEQIDGIEANPTLKKLGIFWLIEQPSVNFKVEQKKLNIIKCSDLQLSIRHYAIVGLFN